MRLSTVALLSVVTLGLATATSQAQYYAPRVIYAPPQVIYTRPIVPFNNYSAFNSFNYLRPGFNLSIGNGFPGFNNFGNNNFGYNNFGYNNFGYNNFGYGGFHSGGYSNYGHGGHHHHHHR